MAEQQSRGTSTPASIAGTVSVIGVDEEIKTLPKIQKLSVTGNFYEWVQEIQLHFESLALWEYVNTNSSAVFTNDAQGTKKQARCKRDIILSLEGELKSLVSHLGTAREMLKRIKLTFVGGDISEKSKLLEKLQQLKYEGNFFTFFTKYQTLMTQVSVRGSGITDTLIMQFLMKLPASLNSVIYPHMKSLEEATTRDTNYNILWNTIYEDLLNFLISCGWFKPNMTSRKKNTILNDNFAMQANNKCWKCGEEGHFRKDCPKKG